jgi:hypothetical protein
MNATRGQVGSQFLSAALRLGQGMSLFRGGEHSRCIYRKPCKSERSVKVGTHWLEAFWISSESLRLHRMTDEA